MNQKYQKEGKINVARLRKRDTNSNYPVVGAILTLGILGIIIGGIIYLNILIWGSIF